MAIETFLIEDSEKMIAETEHLEEWTKTIQELGLEGQKKLIGEPDKSPIPFTPMKVGEKRVYDTLCPVHTDVKTYSKSTIPLRVLSLIALSEREKYFDRIEIWDDSVKPDPIAVGYKDNNEFIIARWGDELRAFVELKKLAMERWIANRKSKIEKQKKQCDSDIQSLGDHSEIFFAGEWVHSYY